MKKYEPNVSHENYTIHIIFNSLIPEFFLSLTNLKLAFQMEAKSHIKLIM